LGVDVQGFKFCRSLPIGAEMTPRQTLASAPRAWQAALGLAAALLAVISLLALAPAAHAESGGLASSAPGTETVEVPSTPASTAETEAPSITSPSGVTPTTPTPSVPGALAVMRGTKAVAPASAPTAVKRLIAAANHIRTTPYIWGGGHASFLSKGYDCSGSVSYALHGAKLLESPLVSGSFMSWGEAGPGRWITIYANKEHVYMVVAGLRWDTGGDENGETGPRWHNAPAYPKGFVVRHPVGY
jgi:cell wall-associated NlpC family hydrolase